MGFYFQFLHQFISKVKAYLINSKLELNKHPLEMKCVSKNTFLHFFISLCPRWKNLYLTSTISTHYQIKSRRLISSISRRYIIIILIHCMVNLISQLILDSVKLISKISTCFCFNWIHEMINHNIFIVKILIQISMFKTWKELNKSWIQKVFQYINLTCSFSLLYVGVY